MKITVDKASKTYLRSGKGTNVFTAVYETELTLMPGTMTCLLGASGSGKSTLLHMIGGLLLPDKGSIWMDELDLHKMDDNELSRFRNRHIGIIPQGQTALQGLNVIDNVMTPYVLYAKSRDAAYDERISLASKLLERAGIAQLSGEMPSALSGGELRRMAVCRALIMQPEVILADEPTGDLDEENTEAVMNMLKEHAASGGTVLVVTHDAQAVKYADNTLEMIAGKVTSCHCLKLS